MPFNQSQLYLVCYDIADPNRLQRVHRYLRETGMPVQYSVFLAHMNRRKLMKMVLELRQLIEAAEDDVRIYPLPRHPERINLGVQFFPEGVNVLSEGVSISLSGYRS